MKQKILCACIFLALAVTTVLVSAFGYYQNEAFYYAFKQRVYLRTVPYKYVIRFLDSTTARGVLLRYEREGLLKTEQWKDERTVLAATGQDTAALLRALRGLKEVRSLQPLYRTAAEGMDLAATEEILLRFRRDLPPIQLDSLVKRYGLVLKQKGEVFQTYLVPKAAGTLATANAVMESGATEFAHPNFFRPLVLHQVPNDAYFNFQWNLHNTGQVINDGHTGTPGADIKAPAAWPISMGSSSVVVAVLDEGVTANHPDLPNTRQVRLNGSNFSTSTPGNDPSPTTNGNHGNACAGIVAATRNNAEGIAGVAPNCRIMPVKLLNPAASDANIANAITFAKNNGAQVLSNSWGYSTSNPNFVPAIVSAIQDAVTTGRGGKGCVLVFAAGNTAHQAAANKGFVTFPGNVNVAGVLTVGASDRYDRQANYSPTSNTASTNNQVVDLVAPSHRAYPSQISGENFEIWSMDQPGTAGYNPSSATYLPAAGTNYPSYTGRMGGTSSACPQVAGAAALLLSLNAALTQQQVFHILTKNADKVGGYAYNASGFSNELGFGRLNLYRAVLQAGADLWMQDQSTDTGLEANPSTLPYYASPDIWVRNSMDGGTVHQNPKANVTNYVYVKVRNRGTLASAASGNNLKLYWAHAAAGLGWSYPWVGANYYCNGNVVAVGGAIGTKAVPAVGAGGSTVLVFPWVPAKPSSFSDCFGAASAHYCLLARLETRPSSPYGMAFPETPDLGANVRNNNNIVWKNVSVIELLPEFYPIRTSVLLTGSRFLRQKFTAADLKLVVPREKGNNNILQAAQLDIDLGVFTGPWLQAGGKVDKGEVYRDPTGRVRIRLYDTAATIYGIPIRPDQIGSITVELATRVFSPDKLFLFDLQLLSQRTVIGGERFDVRFVQEILQTKAGVSAPQAVPEAETKTAQLNAFQNGGQLLLQKFDGRRYAVRILNGNGQVVARLAMTNQASVPAGRLLPGMYIVALTDEKDNRLHTRKVVIR
ncbi:S8 family serine peptidase [Paraflavisolibacter sp. H34]|uniref:S8 family serine peptidase n=1 Tax=Huijunlia imazamoxiresistens TaxID=3127457 RepID=UPI00301A6E90